ncbi:hypothetical protein ABTE72_19405, partial [Acinetobacter baumannii]
MSERRLLALVALLFFAVMTGDRSRAAFVPRLRQRAWNIPRANARRKKPGPLAGAGLLKSKLFGAFASRERPKRRQ